MLVRPEWQAGRRAGSKLHFALCIGLTALRRFQHCERFTRAAIMYPAVCYELHVPWASFGAVMVR